MTTTSTDPVDWAYLKWRRVASHKEYGPYEARMLAKELAEVADKWATTWTTGGDLLKRQAAAQPRSKRGPDPKLA